MTRPTINIIYSSIPSSKHYKDSFKAIALGHRVSYFERNDLTTAPAFHISEL